LCDFAADLRAPTPTAAAEIAVPVRSDLLQRVGQFGLRMSNMIRKKVDLAAERLEAQRRLMPRLSDLAAPHQQRTDDLSERLRQSLRTRIGKAEVAFSAPAMMLHPRLLLRRAEQGQQRLDALTRLVSTLHPEAPLKRGFARVTDANGKTIMTREAAVKAGDVTLRFVDGEVGGQVSGGPAPRISPAKPAKPAGNQGNLFDG
jgi:exodeoxyribonuclease VII large subunit